MSLMTESEMIADLRRRVAVLESRPPQAGQNITTPPSQEGHAAGPAEGAQEPVAWHDPAVAMNPKKVYFGKSPPNMPVANWKPLYAAPIAPPSDLVALLREALEVLPGRGNLRRRIIQTIGESDAPPQALTSDKDSSQGANPGAGPAEGATTKRMCTYDGKECPPAIEGKGPGRCKCEQNGICQRVDMDKLPTITLGATTQNAAGKLGIEPVTKPDERSLEATPAAPSSRVIVPVTLLRRAAVSLRRGIDESMLNKYTWAAQDVAIAKQLDAFAAAPPAPDEDGEQRAAAAESRLRDAFEETRERCAKVCNEMAVKSGNSLVISACGIAANRIRTLAPERTVAGQPDLGSSSEPLVTKATSLDTHERSVFNREDAVGSVTACRDEPASPLLPEPAHVRRRPESSRRDVSDLLIGGMMDKTFDEQTLEIRKEMVMNFPNDPYDEKWAAEFARRIRAAVIAEGGAREPVAEVVAMYGGSGGMTRMLPNVKTPPIGTKLYAASIALPPLKEIAMTDLNHTDAAKYAEIAIESEYKSHANLAACYRDSQAKLEAKTVEARSMTNHNVTLTEQLETERGRRTMFDQKLTKSERHRQNAEARIFDAEQRAETAEQRLREVEAALNAFIIATANGTEGGITDMRTLEGRVKFYGMIDKVKEQAIRALAPDRTDHLIASESADVRLQGSTLSMESNQAGEKPAYPASPLLPGLERAAEICEATHRLYAHECAKFIRAEISRLKGEGSGS